MLKNKLWIVALFAALTMAFFGCTEADHGWEAPVEELDDNALQILPKETWAGIDLNHAKFNFAAGDVIQVTGKALSANTVHISRNHQAWAPIWSQKLNPDEEFDSGKVTLQASDVSAIAGLNPAAMRLYGNTVNGTYIIYNITVTRGGEEIFNFYEIYLKDLKPGTTDPNVIFPDADNTSRSEAWITTADGENNSHVAAVFTVLGPGYGGAAPTPIPEYKGDPTKVVYDNNNTPANAADDKVIDNDPSITGANVVISGNVASFNGAGGIINYKFPAGYIVGSGKKAVTNPLALESDFDYIEIDYTITGEKGGTAGSPILKTRIVQFDDAATGYAERIDKWDSGTSAWVNNNGNWYNGGAAGSNSGKLRLQTWGSGGKGGFSIRINIDDATYTGFNIKINSVTFTKDTRYTVSYFSPQSGYAGSSQKVLTGNGPRLPSMSFAGYTFLGWYDTWDPATQNIVDDPDDIVTAMPGVRVTSATAITSDEDFYAYWLRLKLPTPVVDDTPTFTAASATNTPTVTYDSKTWFLIANNDAPVTTIAGSEPAVDLATQITAITGKGVIYYDTATLAGAFDSTLYNNIRITYDLRLLSDGTTTTTGGFVMRAGTGEGTTEVGGYSNAFEAGDGKTFTTTLGSSFVNGTWGFHVGYGANHAYIIRITKVELIFVP